MEYPQPNDGDLPCLLVSSQQDNTPLSTLIQSGKPYFRFVHPEHLDADPSLCTRVVGILTNPVVDPRFRHVQYIERLPVLKGIVTFSTGTEMINEDICRARGLRVGRIGDTVVKPTADYTMALLLACSRKIPSGKIAINGFVAY